MRAADLMLPSAATCHLTFPLAASYVQSIADTTDDFNTCMASCADGKEPGTIVPAGWGENAEKDIDAIEQSHEIAKLVNCVCKKCSHYNELKSWPAYDNGACEIAAEHTGLASYPS